MIQYQVTSEKYGSTVRKKMGCVDQKFREATNENDFISATERSPMQQKKCSALASATKIFEEVGGRVSKTTDKENIRDGGRKNIGGDGRENYKSEEKWKSVVWKMR